MVKPPQETIQEVEIGQGERSFHKSLGYSVIYNEKQEGMHQIITFKSQFRFFDTDEDDSADSQTEKHHSKFYVEEIASSQEMFGKLEEALFSATRELPDIPDSPRDLEIIWRTSPTGPTFDMVRQESISSILYSSYHDWESLDMMR